VTSVDRRTREQAAVRERILAAARELFVTHGYEAVSLREIARRVEYTAPALYTHFKDKDEILRELCRRDFESLAQAFKRIGRIDDPVERIYRIGVSYIRFAHEYPNQYRLMFMTPDLERVPPSEVDLAEKGDPDHDAYAFLQIAVGEAHAQGVFREDLRDSELLTQVLWSAVHGIASLDISHGDCEWVEWRSLDRRAKVLSEAILRGMLTEKASREFEP
jgi:AcrR family transcriptional regulator